MNVTIIDCFDSFTYNLYQLVGSLGAEPVAVTCNRTIDEVKNTEPDRIILSPGPGTPKDAGICADVIRTYSGKIPILGVCLGHQTIIHTEGGTITRLSVPVHGKTSLIEHDGRGLFQGLECPIRATRYHSLTADPENIPKTLSVCARAQDDNSIMGVINPDQAVYGLQFHPESIMSPSGTALMKNFLSRRGE